MTVPRQNFNRRGPRFTVNHQIRVPELRVLSETGEQLGVMTTREAMEKAQEAGKDLILITENAKPPIAKIIDLAKYKYQQQQREADQRKKQRTMDTKEVRLSPFMSSNDFESKLKKITQFLEKGDKVKLSLQFKGRAITKKEFGFDLFNKVIVATQEIGKVELEPKLLGKKLVAQLTPIK